MSDKERFFRKYYPYEKIYIADKVTIWRRFALLAFAAMLAMMIGLGFSQRDVRAARHQAVKACDAGWQVCRASTGFPVREGDGTCTWRHPDAFTDDVRFGKVDGSGTWKACAWADSPAEEAAEDESSCGVAWGVCLREATR